MSRLIKSELLCVSLTKDETLVIEKSTIYTLKKKLPIPLQLGSFFFCPIIQTSTFVITLRHYLP